MFAIDVAITAYRFVFDNLTSFIAVGWPMIVSMVALDIYGTSDGPNAGLLALIPIIFVITVFELLWCRFYLLGRLNHEWWRGNGLQRAKEALRVHRKLIKKFVLWSFIIDLAFMPPLILIAALMILIFGSLDRIGLFGATILAQLLFCRYFLFFPAVAIGKTETRMRDAFNLGKNYTFKIWLVLSLVAAPGLILSLAIDGPLDISAETSLHPIDFVLVSKSVVSAIITMLMTAFFATAISEVYRHLAGEHARTPSG